MSELEGTLPKKRVAYILCYRDPEYVRSLALIGALRRDENVALTVIRNHRRGVLRYVEVPLKLAWVRLTRSPDIFFVGFRGHEVFWLLYPSMAGKKIVFDEFINLHDWLVNEHRKLRADSLVARLIDRYMKWVHSRSDLILSDTEAHARLSAKTYETCRSKFVAVPVGTDERTFYPRERARRSDRFEVFFFGNMLPLHGMSVILESIESLAETRRIHGIHFSLVGGRGNPQAIRRISDFIETNRLGSSVTHLDWVPYQDLPDHIASADLCLGGPFGNTGQARRVVTGKTYQFLAMGKSTIIGAVEDLTGFEDKHNCLIVEQGAPELLADAIEWAFEHRDRLEEIGSHGLALFESHFSQHAQQQTLRRLVLDPLSL